MDEHPINFRVWRRRIGRVLCTILIVLGLAEWLTSRAISSKLRALTSDRLNAELQLGPVFYLPPYGAWVWGVKLTQGTRELVNLGSTRLRLAEFPRPGRPLVISSFALDRPVLNLSPDALQKLAKPSAGQGKGSPQKLSDVLRLKELHVRSGRITYSDGGAAPMTWDNLFADADLQQQSASRYNFHVLSKALPLADANASGSFDVDELLLEVQSLAFNARAEPNPPRSPLPAGAQKFLHDYSVTAALSISGDARVPLKDPAQSACTLAIALQDGTALVAPYALTLDHARASIVCQKTPGGPITLRLDKIDLGGGGKTIDIDGGTVELNSAANAWKIAELTGHVQCDPPATQSAPATPLDIYRPDGRIDFTIAASGPLKLAGQDPWTTIDHEIIAYPRGVSFQPKGFARPIENIGGGEVRLTHGAIVFQELRGRYGGDILRLRSARLPVRDLPRVARWQEISGDITFNPPLRRYEPDLDKILDVLNPSGPFLFAGSWTLDRTGPREKKTYDLILSSDNGAVTLTDRKITLSNIRGDATMTPDGIELHSADADVLGGKLHAALRCTPGDALSYQGDLAVRDLDLGKLEEQVRDERIEKPLRGRVFIESSFSGKILSAADHQQNRKSLHAEGVAEIVDASLTELPVFRHVTQRIQGLKQATTASDAAAEFDITAGVVHLRDAAMNSPVLGLQGDGNVGFDGKLDLNVVAAPLADWREKFHDAHLPLIGDLAGAVQKMLNTATGSLFYQFRVGGTVKDVQVTTVPAPVLSDAAVMVFGKMLAPVKDRRPLEWLKRKPTTHPATKSGPLSP